MTGYTISSDGTDLAFTNPRIRIWISKSADSDTDSDLDKSLKWILCQTKNNKISHYSYIDKLDRLFANKNNKSDKWFQNNSNSIQNVTNSLENFTNLLQNLTNLMRKVYNTQNFSLQNQNPNPCVFTSNPTRIRIWEFRSDFSDSDIRPITNLNCLHFF